MVRAVRQQLEARHQRGAVAQLGERCNRTAEVTGSIPVSSIEQRPAATIEGPAAVIALKWMYCPPLIGRTESSNDGERGSSGETAETD